jgi:hypothetical protein
MQQVQFIFLVMGGISIVLGVDAYYNYFPRKSPHAHHGAACSKNGMPVLSRHTLASVPHHN